LQSFHKVMTISEGVPGVVLACVTAACSSARLLTVINVGISNRAEA